MFLYVVSPQPFRVARVRSGTRSRTLAYAAAFELDDPGLPTVVRDHFQPWSVGPRRASTSISQGSTLATREFRFMALSTEILLLVERAEIRPPHLDGILNFGVATKRLLPLYVLVVCVWSMESSPRDSMYQTNETIRTGILDTTGGRNGIPSSDNSSDAARRQPAFAEFLAVTPLQPPGDGRLSERDSSSDDERSALSPLDELK